MREWLSGPQRRAWQLAPCPETDPSQQRGHADQNQAIAAVLAAQGKSEDVERTAFAENDARQAGGDRFNLKDG